MAHGLLGKRGASGLANVRTRGLGAAETRERAIVYMQKVDLVINASPAPLRSTERLEVRNCPDLRSALAALQAGADGCGPVAMVAQASAGTLATLRQAALDHSAIQFVWLMSSALLAEAGDVSRFGNIWQLPENAGPEWIEPLLARALHDHEHRRENRELLEGTVAGAVSTLFEVLSIADPYSASLGQRLRYAADLFCKSARLDLTWELETAALLAEIGILTIPTRVVAKAQSGQELSGFEKDLIARVPERGADLLQQIPAFRHAARIVRYQGKNFDGTGLPSDSLAMERLPLGARILKVLTELFRLKDTGKTQEEAMQELRHHTGRFDPMLLEVAQDCFKVNVPANVAGSTQPLTVRELRPGQLLVSNILTDDGVLLIRDGQVISARLLHKLRNFAFTSGVKEPIYVIDLLRSREMTTTFQDIAQAETTFIYRR